MPRPKKLDRHQGQKFIETARELGCNEDEAAFDEKLKRITKPQPKPAKDEKEKAPE